MSTPNSPPKTIKGFSLAWNHQQYISILPKLEQELEMDDCESNAFATALSRLILTDLSDISTTIWYNGYIHDWILQATDLWTHQKNFSETSEGRANLGVVHLICLPVFGMKNPVIDIATIRWSVKVRRKHV